MANRNLHSMLYSLYDSDPKPVADFIKWLAESYALPDALCILDMGAGPGRMLKPYSEMDWKVVAMEPNNDFAAQLIANAARLDDVRTKPGGFNDLTDDETYNLVAAVNDPFAYLLTPESRIDAVRRVYRALKPGGVFFIDVPNFLYIMKHYQIPQPAKFNMDSGDVVRRTSEHSFDFHDAIWTHTDTFQVDDGVNDTNYVTQEHKFAMVALPELLHLLREQKFTSIRTYNSYEAREDERITGARILLSAQKPAAEAEPAAEPPAAAEKPEEAPEPEQPDTPEPPAEPRDTPEL